MDLLLTRRPTGEEVTGGLQSWAWLDFTGRHALLGSLFGDLFFAADDGRYWYLDVIEGTFQARWESRESFAESLNSPAGQEEFLLDGLAFSAYEEGIWPAEDEILVFTPPPILGGAFDVDNLTTMDAEAGLHMLGQLHDQVRNLRRTQ